MYERDYYCIRKRIVEGISNMASPADGACSWIFDEASDLRAICQELLAESADNKTKPFITRHLDDLTAVEKEVPQLKRKLAKAIKEVAKRNAPNKTEFARAFALYSDAVASTMVLVQKLESIRASALGMALAAKEMPKELVEMLAREEETPKKGGQPSYIG